MIDLPHWIRNAVPEDNDPERVGPTWKCPVCGSRLRLNDFHLGGRHAVIFVDGQPILQKEGKL